MRFVDTSFWYAAVDRSDGRHAEALVIKATGIGRAITTDLVVGESWTTFRKRLGHETAIRFLDGLAALPDVEVVAVDETAKEAAWAWLRRHDERPYSFVDATSFAVMRQRRIREALTFDRDFSAAGFVEVRAS